MPVKIEKSEYLHIMALVKLIKGVTPEPADVHEAYEFAEKLLRTTGAIHPARLPKTPRK